MNLYFNGCSHTWGDDLEDPATQSWPVIVSKNLNCNFFNDSVSGGTNDRIVYRTIKNADQFDKFYIGWTYTSRFTRYRADNNFEINFNSRLKNPQYDKDESFLQYGKLHYKYWHNELYSFKLWLQNIVLLQRYFDSIKKPYVMVNADHNYVDRWTTDWPSFNNSVKSMLCFDLMNDRQLKQEHQEIKKLIEQICFDHYPGWNTWWITKLNNKYSVGTTGHLLEDGHQAVADYILQHDSN
jgi:hypothetical protein